PRPRRHDPAAQALRPGGRGPARAPPGTRVGLVAPAGYPRMGTAVAVRGGLEGAQAPEESVNELRTGGPQPPWPAGAAWLDGRYRPIEDARISVLDLGVTRSDCTYDVVHVWEGRFYRLDAHLDRFGASMARLRLDPGCDRAGIEDALHGCVRHAGLRAAYVSMTCTRGRMPAGSRDLRTARSMFYCYAVPFIWISAPSSRTR